MSATIETVCILTAERPQLLRRCLDSLAQSMAAAGRRPSVIVIDDSLDSAAQVANRAVVAGAGGRTGVSYYGHAERAGTAASLTAAGIPSDVVSFALFGDLRAPRRTGASRNAALLAAVGTLFLSLDDDVECRFTRSPEAVGGVHAFDGYDPSEYWFHASRDDLLRSHTFESLDVLALHERLLGAAPGVLYTMTGLAGDCGMATPRTHWLGGSSRRRLLEEPATYETSLTSREVLKVAPAYTVSAGRFCMTYCIGFDNSAGLLPFFPIGRNSDGTFGAMLKRLVPDSRSGHIPWAIYHAPAAARAFGRDVLWNNTRHHDMARVMAALLRRTAPGLDLASLGRAFLELASADLHTFARELRRALEAYVADTIGTLRQAASDLAWTPEYWRRDFDAFLHCLESSVGADPLAFRDIPHAESPGEAIRQVQHMVRLFARLLMAWPDMVGTARRIASDELCARSR